MFPSKKKLSIFFLVIFSLNQKLKKKKKKKSKISVFLFILFAIFHLIQLKSKKSQSPMVNNNFSLSSVKGKYLFVFPFFILEILLPNWDPQKDPTSLTKRSFFQIQQD